MKIGVVGTVGLTPAKNSQKLRSNSNYKISFGSVEQDCFVKRDRAQIFENMKKIYDAHDEMFYKIKPEVDELRNNISDLTNKASQVQAIKCVSDDDKSPLAQFIRSMKKDEMKPVNELYDILEESIAGRLNYGAEESVKQQSSAGCILFKSRDRQLAKDMTSLYPFYGLFRKDKQETASGVFELLDMYNNKNYLFETEILDSSNKQTSDYFNQIMQKLTDSASSKRTGYFIIDDLESLMDENRNSKENVETMKDVLENSFDKFKSIIIASAQEAPENAQDGFIREIDLDNLGITKDHVEAIKRAKREIGAQVEEFASLYGKVPSQELERMEKLKPMFADLTRIDKELENFIFTKKRSELCIGVTDDEFYKLSHLQDVEPYTKTKASLLAKLLEEKIAQGGAEEVIEASVPQINEKPIQQAAKKTFKDNIDEIINKIKNMPPNKTFKYAAIGLAIVTGITYIAKRIKTSKQLK